MEEAGYTSFDSWSWLKYWQYTLHRIPWNFCQRPIRKVKNETSRFLFNYFYPSEHVHAKLGTSAAWPLLNKFSLQILFFIHYKAMVHWLSLIICFQLTKHRASFWGQLVHLIHRGEASLESLLIYLLGPFTRVLPVRPGSCTRQVLSPCCFSLGECDCLNPWYNIASNKTITPRVVQCLG